MQISRADLADFAYFMAIARHRSFRQAALEMGVTPSALSHAMAALEARRGVRLLNRTTRSVTLTAAGEDLRAMIGGPLERIAEASENLNRFRDAPAGRVRINVLEDAVALLLDPVMPLFVDRYPDVSIDISVSNRMIDVIAGGFDAGIRYGGTVPEDMVARRLSPAIRWMAAASPAYLERFGAPSHPRDLKHHRCIGIRLGNDQLYKWEFERGVEAVEVATPGPLTVNESHAALGFGRAGVGIIYSAEPVLRGDLANGALVPVLPEWSSMGEGFHVYYPGRRQVPAALRLLIDLIRELRPLGL
ncbi:LysR family transcriptional regulator [Novosphingobium album (ex Hu et al. 2023)]|uniref:LysR family transcriptional regulator n=1 Tax=Novosphingobium album (ex Hu et al. 2023) TaxID=2930093 RepID=A0ABT0B681_9SPHN|nr:LysR family transcriptional regulator [Novosphingobium album (ex Hu et al. 2023)]MCJ2180592.1 LysR family transcriptional regulator [Novosphingobium album (ex Hu et al. 2023)]